MLTLKFRQAAVKSDCCWRIAFCNAAYDNIACFIPLIKTCNVKICFLQALSDMSSIPTQNLWLPNTKGVLHESGNLIINDAPWLETQGMNFVHDKLSYEVHSKHALEVLP